MLAVATSLRRAARSALQTRHRALAAIAATAQSQPHICAELVQQQSLSLLVASRSFATSSSSSDDTPATASSTGGAAINAVDENRFLELADTALHDIMSWLDGVEEMLEESDISLSQGVLKIDLGENGTWVINRQIPNRQLWWSSPISGPRRYELDAATATWRNTRDGTELMELLRNEIFEASGIEIYE